MFSIRSHYGDSLYSHTYWSLAILDAGLQFALIVEIAGKVFRPQGSWAIDVRGKLLLWLLVSFVIAVVLAELQHPKGDDALQVHALRIGFLSIILNAELFTGMMALSSQAGLNWKGHVASIATGLYHAASLPTRRHVKIKQDANPYHPSWEMYFEARESRQTIYTLMERGTLLYLWHKQGGRCIRCGEPITKETGWHRHYLVPKVLGGPDNASNCQLLHPECHRQIHSQLCRDHFRVSHKAFTHGS